MAAPMSALTFWTGTMSSERSTLVRRCPSTPGLLLWGDVRRTFCAREWLGEYGSAYRIPGGELLLRTNDGSTSLRSVESGFATDDRLFLRRSASDFAADFGNGIPIVHDVRGSEFEEGWRLDGFCFEALFAWIV